MLPEGLLEERLRDSQIFPPKENHVSVKFQQLFPFAKPVVTEVLRDFYEGVARALFSGDVRNRSCVDGDLIEPDLTSIPRRRYIEVKAVRHTGRVMLKDAQVEKYVQLQISEKPIETPRVYFTIFRYGTRGIEKRVAGFSKEQITEHLCSDTRFLIGLPFSVIYTVHQAGYTANPFFTRCDSAGAVPCTNFSTRAIDFFFSGPNSAITAIGLDPIDYDIKFKRIPDTMIVNSYPLKPFPIVLIKEREEFFTDWVRQLKEKSLEDVPF